MRRRRRNEKKKKITLQPRLKPQKLNFFYPDLFPREETGGVLWKAAPWQEPPLRKTIMHCYQHGVIWLLTKYLWQWEWKQLEVCRVVIKKMLSCATLHLEQIWINIALRGHTHAHRDTDTHTPKKSPLIFSGKIRVALDEVKFDMR